MKQSRNAIFAGAFALAAAAAAQAAVATAAQDSWGDIFSRILADKIEPRLGEGGRATILCEYPLPQAALARAKPGTLNFAAVRDAIGCPPNQAVLEFINGMQDESACCNAMRRNSCCSSMVLNLLPTIISSDIMMLPSGVRSSWAAAETKRDWFSSVVSIVPAIAGGC